MQVIWRSVMGISLAWPFLTWIEFAVEPVAPDHCAIRAPSWQAVECMLGINHVAHPASARLSRPPDPVLRLPAVLPLGLALRRACGPAVAADPACGSLRRHRI